MSRAALAITVLMILAAAESAAPPTSPAREPVVVAGETFRLEIAADEASRRKGLAGREKIADHGGMLFVFRDARRRSFWMKDCLVDIDILFLDDRGRITAVYRMKKQPPRGADEGVLTYERRLKRYASRRPARFAIELEAGSIERLELEPGRAIELDLPRLKDLADRTDPPA